MNEMIKYVARAICRVQTPTVDPDVLVEWGPSYTGPKGSRVVLPSQQIPAWHLFVHDASAAIQAMREPIEAMIEAGYGFHWGSDQAANEDERENVKNIYQAMIDEALK